MLGIFLIICLAGYWFIKLKIYLLLKDDNVQPVEISSESRTYNVCHRASVLDAISVLIVLLGFIGCGWPYLFIKGIDRIAYLFYIAMGLLPVLAIAHICYLAIRNVQGYIRVGADEIEYKRSKSFSVKVSDIKKIAYLGLYSYKIHLKAKGKKPLTVNLNGFHKKKEICSLMEQLRDRCARESGRDKSLIYKIGYGLELIRTNYFAPLVKIMVTLLLLYASYCCIDYDFFRKDYTALFNALGAEPNQAENAWPYYVQAAVNYKPLETDLQDIIGCQEPNNFDFNDEQIEGLLKWFKENASSWASLKKAVSINYCNATYKNISFPFNSTDRKDFSNPFDNGYGQIRHLYNNANAGCLAGALDLDRLELFEMLLASAKHFVNGKTFMDQLVGYGMLARSIKLLAEEDSYKPEDLQKARTLLKEYFPVGLPPLSIEGEILMICSTFDSMLSSRRIPVQTPLNPVFLAIGSRTGTEAYARKYYTTILEQAHKGVMSEPNFPRLSFPMMRNLFFCILSEPITMVYKPSQRAGTNFSAAYVVLDLEEYKLLKGSYPADISQFGQAGLKSQLPDDPDSKDKIIYRNDGQRAILYAVGQNGKDDGGYNDGKGNKKRDDIIYWQRDLEKK